MDPSSVTSSTAAQQLQPVATLSLVLLASELILLQAYLVPVVDFNKLGLAAVAFLGRTVYLVPLLHAAAMVFAAYHAQFYEWSDVMASMAGIAVNAQSLLARIFGLTVLSLFVLLLMLRLHRICKECAAVRKHNKKLKRAIRAVRVQTLVQRKRGAKRGVKKEAKPESHVELIGAAARPAANTGGGHIAAVGIGDDVKVGPADKVLYPRKGTKFGDDAPTADEDRALAAVAAAVGRSTSTTTTASDVDTSRLSARHFAFPASRDGHDSSSDEDEDEDDSDEDQSLGDMIASSATTTASARPSAGNMRRRNR